MPLTLDALQDAGAYSFGRMTSETYEWRSRLRSKAWARRN